MTSIDVITIGQLIHEIRHGRNATYLIVGPTFARLDHHWSDLTATLQSSWRGRRVLRRLTRDSLETRRGVRVRCGTPRQLERGYLRGLTFDGVVFVGMHPIDLSSRAVDNLAPCFVHAQRPRRPGLAAAVVAGIRSGWQKGARTDA